MPSSSRSILPDGDAGPAGDHLAHQAAVHAHPHQRGLALQRLQLLVEAAELRAERRGIGRSRRRACRCPRRASSWPADLADLLHQSALALPPLGERRQPGLGLGSLAAIAASRSAWSAPTAALALAAPAVCTSRSSRAPARVLDGGRRGVLAERQAGARGVEHAHRLVGQLPVGQISVRQPHRRIEPVVEDAHQCDASRAPA